MNKSDQKRMRAIAAKLSRPRPLELPSGKWRCQVMVNGKRIDIIDDDPAVAHAKALAVKSGLLEQRAPTDNITVGDAIDRYIQSKDAVLSPSTIAGYRKIHKFSLQGILAVPVASLTPEMVQIEINRMAKEKSPKTVRNAHGLLSAALSVYRPNLLLHTTLPQKRRYDAAIPSWDDIILLTEAAYGTSMELPFLLGIWLGLRESEIRGLTWDCVDGDTLHIKQALVDGERGPVLKSTKTYSGNRKLHLPEYILSLIKKQPHINEYIVQKSGQAIYKGFCRLCEKAGVRHYRFHDLRHGNASVMLALGVPDKYAMERMGHATNNMLKTVYQHTMDDKRESVSNVVDHYFEEKLHTHLHMK